MQSSRPSPDLTVKHKAKYLSEHASVQAACLSLAWQLVMRKSTCMQKCERMQVDLQGCLELTVAKVTRALSCLPASLVPGLIGSTNLGMPST